MTRREILMLLLAHREDALVSGTADGRGSENGSRLLMHDPDLWCEAFEELERGLVAMRKLGKQQAVRYTRVGGKWDGREESCALANARWHLLAWYSPIAYKMTPAQQRVRGSNKRITVMVSRPVRDPEARQDRADAGLTWLASAYRWNVAYPSLTNLAKTNPKTGQRRLPGLELSGFREAA